MSGFLVTVLVNPTIGLCSCRYATVKLALHSVINIYVYLYCLPHPNIRGVEYEDMYSWPQNRFNNFSNGATIFSHASVLELSRSQFVSLLSLHHVSINEPRSLNNSLAIFSVVSAAPRWSKGFQ